jgi:hypothetical protein
LKRAQLETVDAKKWSQARQQLDYNMKALADLIDHLVGSQLASLIQCNKCGSDDVVLVLDRLLQNLPWERLQALQNCAVYRMPSLPFLLQRLQMEHSEIRNVSETRFVRTAGWEARTIDSRNATYILDPERDLVDGGAAAKSHL